MWYFDGDNDQFGNSLDGQQSSSQPVGYVRDDGDCDDTNSAVHPGATEQPNGFDDNCDGVVDEGFTCYADDDVDGHGSGEAPCVGSWSENDLDCDDQASGTHPQARERYNQIDDDCDGAVDEGFVAWFADQDRDGYGDPANIRHAVSRPLSHVTDGTDCDDGSSAVHPGAVEAFNGIDDNCDGAVDEGFRPWYADADADGAGDAADLTMATEQPEGRVLDALDCDDRAPETYPGAVETDDGRDNDCDGDVDEGIVSWFRDFDADGFGDPATSSRAVSAAAGFVMDGSDCDDASAQAFPGAIELDDGLDNDCDGDVDEGLETWFLDRDGDGYAGPESLRVPARPPNGFPLHLDCDDLDAAVHPGATEMADDLDHDCDGENRPATLGSESANEQQASAPAVLALLAGMLLLANRHRRR